jgi:hypothetical protein
MVAQRTASHCHVDGSETWKIVLMKFTNMGQIDSSFGDQANTAI